MMNTESGLNKILDFTRLLSILLLLLYGYVSAYDLVKSWDWSSILLNRLLQKLFSDRRVAEHFLKWSGFGLLQISLLGSAGRKNPESTLPVGLGLFGLGVGLFWFDRELIPSSLSVTHGEGLSLIILFVGYGMMLSGGARLSRVIHTAMGKDIFNHLNETFPQEERRLYNEFSINLPAVYQLRKKTRNSWINIINPFRGILITGTPGSGKSYFIIQEIIRQHIEKGFAMLIYDFKFDDLSKIAFNHLRRCQSLYTVVPEFLVINFDDLQRSHRCNPLDPAAMTDITDAAEAARSILLGLNRDWITKQGDFFVESPIIFLTAILWFLRKYQNGRFCTLPHAIELMQVEYDKLFPILKEEQEIEALINPFVSAYQHDAMEQLEGQIASAKIGMARLSSPQLYWVLSQNDISLDINNPENPKILCLANNPQKQQTYGAVLSLFTTRLIKIINQKNKLKCSLIFDEFPTIFFNGMDGLMATARSNKVSTTLAMQDFSQLKKDYGHDQAAIIINMAGNILSGQAFGETGKQLMDRFGKIVQQKDGYTISRTDTSFNKSSQLDYAIPQAKIAGLSSGEFVGMVADNPDEKIQLKVFHCNIKPEFMSAYSCDQAIPTVNDSKDEEIYQNYLTVKREISEMVRREIELLLSSRV